MLFNFLFLLCKISFKEICQRAGVNRSTFYLHYETIGDLLSERVENTNKVFLSYFEQRNGNFVDKIDELPIDELILISREYLIPYLRYISESRAVFIAAIKNPYGMRSAIKFEGLQRHIFEPILDRFYYPSNERKYAISYYSKRQNNFYFGLVYCAGFAPQSGKFPLQIRVHHFIVSAIIYCAYYILTELLLLFMSGLEAGAVKRQIRWLR